MASIGVIPQNVTRQHIKVTPLVRWIGRIRCRSPTPKTVGDIRFLSKEKVSTASTLPCSLYRALLIENALKRLEALNDSLLFFDAQEHHFNPFGGAGFGAVSSLSSTSPNICLVDDNAAVEKCTGEYRLCELEDDSMMAMDVDIVAHEEIPLACVENDALDVGKSDDIEAVHEQGFRVSPYDGTISSTQEMPQDESYVLRLSKRKLTTLADTASGCETVDDGSPLGKRKTLSKSPTSTQEVSQLFEILTHPIQTPVLVDN